MITITLPDGSKKEYKEGITPKEIAESIGEGLARAALAAKIDGEFADLFQPIEKDAEVQILTFKDDDGRFVFEHSASHLMTQAVQRVFKDQNIGLGVGFPVDNAYAFYQDYDMKPIKEEDLKKIEEEMKKIVKEDLPITKRVIPKDEAKEYYKNDPYKIELADDVPSDMVSMYCQGEFDNLCKGPHVPRTGMIKAFKLKSIAGAYWRGDAKKQQLIRIYGVAFPDKKMLKDHLAMLEEAERRNHKKIGEEMELFTHFDLVGKGLPIWLPKGEIIRQEIENLAIEKERKAGYVRVNTPHLSKKELFLKSGHLPYYEDSMYPMMKMDDGEYYLKAMNCPCHHLIFARKSRSYRELPLRLAEYGTCYRNELSGTLNGLLRVRSLRMNDAHIYCRKDQIEEEVKAVLNMIKEYFDIFDLEDFWFRLSLSDLGAKDKYIDEPENWEHSESILRKVLEELKLPFVEAKDEAAFYGPKIDVQFKNVYGREETMSTVQLDFAAKKRFELSYIDEKNEKNGEVFVIHRAPLSTHERFLAFLIEHYAGKFPLWLSPVQVRLLSIADRHVPFCQEVKKQMEEKGLRVEIDDQALTMNKKIRNAQLAKINYICVVGDKELENKSVNVRTRDNEVHGEKKVDELISQLVEEVRERK